MARLAMLLEDWNYVSIEGRCGGRRKFLKSHGTENCEADWKSQPDFSPQHEKAIVEETESVSSAVADGFRSWATHPLLRRVRMRRSRYDKRVQYAQDLSRNLSSAINLDRDTALLCD
jgi:hypothetical protein